MKKPPDIITPDWFDINFTRNIHFPKEFVTHRYMQINLHISCLREK